MYLTYEEYQNMGGTLDETTFNNYYYQAKALIDYVTFDRLIHDTTFPTELKYCVFRLINMVQQKNDALSMGWKSDGNVEPAITRQDNDGVSISYNAMSADRIFDLLRTESESTIRMYLADVRNEAGRKVLYRGIYPDE